MERQSWQAAYYIGHVDPAQSADDIVAHLRSLGCTTSPIITCLRAKDDWKPFCVELSCDKADEFFHGNLWPSGVVVRPFRSKERADAAQSQKAHLKAAPAAHQPKPQSTPQPRSTQGRKLGTSPQVEEVVSSGAISGVGPEARTQSATKQRSQPPAALRSSHGAGTPGHTQVIGPSYAPCHMPPSPVGPQVPSSTRCLPHPNPNNLDSCSPPSHAIPPPPVCQCISPLQSIQPMVVVI